MSVTLQEKPATQTTAQQIEIRPIAGRIGAEIANIKLRGDLDAESYQAIRHALLQYRVIFFRGQQHLEDAEQERFARLFGDLVAHPTEQVRNGSTAILELDTRNGNGRADQWHTDVTFVDAYPQISILRAVQVPSFGGDTVWANTVAAYDHLPAELKDLADRLWAVHSNKYDYAAQRPQATEAERKHYESTFAATVYETEHPVVRLHPETGEKSLVLGYFIQKFVGQNHVDSARLFEILQDHVTRLENTVRWRWQAGDVAIWDNRATQHIAINDYGDQRRIMRRSTIAGDVPVSIDGKHSHTRRKVTPLRQQAAE
jgi:taurine dioxygenase